MSVQIVPASQTTLAEIEAWLKAEDAAYQAAMEAVFTRREVDVEIPGRGFYCNWNLVLTSYRRDPANVHVLIADGAVVGFVDEMDILEVRADQRGKGYGRMLAEFMIGRAFERGLCVAQIEVAPDTALPFWRQMGFTADKGRQGPGGGIYAYRRFERNFSLGDGPRVPYRIAFYPPERKWEPFALPFEVFEGQGERLPGGGVQLARRAYCFDAGRETSPKCVVTIEIDGALLFADRIKLPEARELGVLQDPDCTYYIDHVSAPSALQGLQP
jgi:GNAT superfamily N-acetyltransferase